MSKETLFALPEAPVVAVNGESRTYPVHRIFCVGRNYAEHAREMGTEVDREAPFYFLKGASCTVESGRSVPYPPGTANYHHEVELVVAIGSPTFQADGEAAEAAIYGYAVGLDMTRRDLQQAARAKQRPWDLGKDFEQSAVVAPITRKAGFGAVGRQRISLAVNGTLRQEAVLADLVWSVPELISDLSRYYHLVPGDLIFTGTPAGVGPVVPGDTLVGNIDGLTTCRLDISAPE